MCEWGGVSYEESSTGFVGVAACCYHYRLWRNGRWRPEKLWFFNNRGWLNETQDDGGTSVSYWEPPAVQFVSIPAYGEVCINDVHIPKVHCDTARNVKRVFVFSLDGTISEEELLEACSAPDEWSIRLINSS